MKNTYKIILGSAFAIAIIGGAYVNRPRIEVTAEATANATSTVIEAQFKDLPKDTYITCDFTVGNMGGTTLNYVTK